MIGNFLQEKDGKDSSFPKKLAECTGKALPFAWPTHNLQTRAILYTF